MYHDFFLCSINGYIGAKSCISIEIFLNFFKTNVSIKFEENLILYMVRNNFDKIHGKLELSIIMLKWLFIM